MSKPAPATTGEWTAITVDDLARYNGYKGVADAHNSALAAERDGWNECVVLLNEEHGVVAQLREQLDAVSAAATNALDQAYAKGAAAERSCTAAARRMQEEGAMSHGKTALMCEKTIKQLSEQLDAAVEALKRISVATLILRCRRIADAALAKIGEGK